MRTAAWMWRKPPEQSYRKYLAALRERELAQAIELEKRQPKEAEQALRRALWAERALNRVEDRS